MSNEDVILRVVERDRQYLVEYGGRVLGMASYPTLEHRTVYGRELPMRYRFQFEAYEIPPAPAAPKPKRRMTDLGLRRPK